MAKNPATVTLKVLAAEIAEQHNLSKKQSEQMVGEIAALLQDYLTKGVAIRLAGFGVLQVRERAARMGRNPMTGVPALTKPGKKIAFRASKELKEAVADAPEEALTTVDNGGGSTDW